MPLRKLGSNCPSLSDGPFILLWYQHFLFIRVMNNSSFIFNSSLKIFWIRIFIFSLCFFALDKLFVFQRNRISSLEVDTRLENIVSGQMNKDVLIFGSSRGARNIIASQITSE